MTGLVHLIPIRYLAILLSVAIAIGLYFLLLGFRLLVGKYSLLTIPTSEIRSAARGLVEVSGLAAGPCTTLAPITGEPCFLYYTTVWQQGERKNNQWEKVADETLHLPFFVDDSTGQLLIDALGADLELHPRFRGEYSESVLRSDDVPLSVSRFLSRHGVALDRSMRIEERLIKAGDALFVAASLMDNPGLEMRPVSASRNDRGGIRDSDHLRDNFRDDTGNHYQRASAQSNSSEQFPAPEIVRLASCSAPSSTREMSQQGKIAAALTRAGLAGPQTWSSIELPHQRLAVEEAELPANLSSRSEVRLPEVRVRRARPDEAGAEEDFPNQGRPNQDRPNQDHLNEDHGDEHGTESSKFNLTPPVLLMKGASETTFVISCRSQREIVSAIAWKAAAMVGLGTAVTLFSFYTLWAGMASL